VRIYDIPRTPLVFTGTDISKTFTIIGSPSTYFVFKGMNERTLIEIPNWSNDVTLEFKVQDPNGNATYYMDGLSRNQNIPPVIITDPFPVFEGCVVIITLSGVPGGNGGTVYNTIYYISDRKR